MVVGLSNGLVRIFQIATGQLIAELDCKGAVSRVNIILRFKLMLSVIFIHIEMDDE